MELQTNKELFEKQIALLKKALPAGKATNDKELALLFGKLDFFKELVNGFGGIENNVSIIPNLGAIEAEFENGAVLVTTILQKPVVGMAIQTLEEKELAEKLEAEKLEEEQSDSTSNKSETDIESVALNN